MPFVLLLDPLVGSIGVDTDVSGEVMEERDCSPLKLLGDLARKPESFKVTPVVFPVADALYGADGG